MPVATTTTTGAGQARRDAAATKARPINPPVHAEAATTWIQSTSTLTERSPQSAAWPVRLLVSATPTAASRATIPARRAPESEPTRATARAPRRASQSVPKWVRPSTVGSASSVTVAPPPVMVAARWTSSASVAPIKTTMQRQRQRRRRSRVASSSAPPPGSTSRSRPRAPMSPAIQKIVSPRLAMAANETSGVIASTDAEREVALGPVPVARDHAPEDPVAPRRERRHADLQEPAILRPDPAVPAVHALLVAVLDANGAEHGLDLA